MLSQLGPQFDIVHWDTWKGDRWAGPIGVLANIVRSCAVRDKATADNPEGDQLPEDGYSVVLSGAGPRVGLHIRISAGALTAGRRLPRHHLSIQLREVAEGGVTGEVGDRVCSAVVQAWQPAMLELADPHLRQAARRGGWKIGVGYRLWLNHEVGLITQVAEGLSTTSLGRGTLISAPDDWPAERVIAAMTATLAANRLDEIPH
ncbi:hypothetical protein ACX9NE_18500 [Mycobacterium sp. ML4]